jgi:hypothetical protein
MIPKDDGSAIIENILKGNALDIAEQRERGL